MDRSGSSSTGAAIDTPRVLELTEQWCDPPGFVDHVGVDEGDDVTGGASNSEFASTGEAEVAGGPHDSNAAGGEQQDVDVRLGGRRVGIVDDDVLVVELG